MILGIDGGGSKTQFLLCEKNGKVLAEYTTGTANYLQVGFDGYQKVLERGLASILEAADCRVQDLDLAIVGTPAYGEIAEDAITLEEKAAEIFPFSHELLNDVKLAWAGALACEPGVVVLSGTGSMAFAVDETGQDLRCGGWGEGFGDEGSAYWLGREACQLFSKMADGRLERGPLYALMRDKFNLKNDFDLIQYTANQSADQARSNMAGLARILHQAYVAGDREAEKAFKRGAAELALLAYGVLGQYRGAEPVRLSYAGGVFAAGEFLIQELQQALGMILKDSLVQFQAPILSPVRGACLYGAITHTQGFSGSSGFSRENFIQKLKV